jgi:hypothetical protein
VFGYHPHGVIGMGAIANFGTEATGFSRLFPGLVPHLLTLSSNFKLPIYRELLLFMGIGSVSMKSCQNILKQGQLFSLIISALKKPQTQLRFLPQVPVPPSPSSLVEPPNPFLPTLEQPTSPSSVGKGSSSWRFEAERTLSRSFLSVRTMYVRSRFSSRRFTTVDADFERVRRPPIDFRATFERTGNEAVQAAEALPGSLRVHFACVPLSLLPSPS